MGLCLGAVDKHGSDLVGCRLDRVGPFAVFAGLTSSRGGGYEERKACKCMENLVSSDCMEKILSSLSPFFLYKEFNLWLSIGVLNFIV